MLPFLEPKKITSIIIARHGKMPVESNSEMEAGEDRVDPDLKMASEDLLRAIQSGSVIDIAHAFEAAFQACDASPHYEGPHENEEDGE